MSSLEFNDGDSDSRLMLLGWGCLLAGFWLPFQRVAFAVQAIGCGLMGMACSRLVPLHARFAKATIWAYAGAALSLVDTLAPFHNVLNRIGISVNLPFSYFFADLALAGAVWQIAAAFVELAAQHKTIPLRDAAGSRRDFFLISIFLLTFVAGPAAVMLSSGIIGTGTYRALWWGANLFHFFVLGLWWHLCRRTARGLDWTEGDL